MALDVGLVGGGRPVAELVGQLAQPGHVQVSHACVRPRTGRLSAGAAHSSETARWEPGGQDWLSASGTFGSRAKFARRVLEDLALLGIAVRTKRSTADNSPDLWTPSEWLLKLWPGRPLSVPEM
jgi:hypothetical protein